MFKRSLLTRANISSYYIALLFSVLFFQQEWFRNIILVIVNYLRQVFQVVNKTTTNDWTSYGALVFSCFVFVMLMRWLVVKPANLFMNDETARDNFEAIPFFVAVSGAFLFYINIYFGDIMPHSIAKEVRGILGGEGADLSLAVTLWNTSPIVMFFLINGHRRRIASENAEKK